MILSNSDSVLGSAQGNSSATLLAVLQDLLGNLNDSNVNALKSRGQDVLWSKICLVTINADSKLICVLSCLNNAGSYAACSVEDNVATIGVRWCCSPCLHKQRRRGNHTQTGR